MARSGNSISRRRGRKRTSRMGQVGGGTAGAGCCRQAGGRVGGLLANPARTLSCRRSSACGERRRFLNSRHGRCGRSKAASRVRSYCCVCLRRTCSLHSPSSCRASSPAVRKNRRLEPPHQPGARGRRRSPDAYVLPMSTARSSRQFSPEWRVKPECRRALGREHRSGGSRGRQSGR